MVRTRRMTANSTNSRGSSQDRRSESFRVTNAEIHSIPGNQPRSNVTPLNLNKSTAITTVARTNDSSDIILSPSSSRTPSESSHPQAGHQITPFLGDTSAGSAESMSLGINNETSYMPLKFAIDIIPKFSGDPFALNDFIRQCKIAEILVKPGDKRHLLTLIYSKLDGDARDVIGDQYGTGNLNELLDILNAAFAQSLDIDHTQYELKSTRQKDTEKVMQFGARVRKVLNQGLKLATGTFSADELTGVRSMLYRTACKSFVKGLRNALLSSRVSDAQPKNLEDAIKIATIKEREKDERDQHFSNITVNDDKHKNKFIQVHKMMESRACYNCKEIGHIR